jgi:alkylhydroperoxidase family enzyme
MTDRSIAALDLPDVRDEVTRCFLAYDAALLAGDVASLDTWFFDGQQATRFGLGQELYGAEEIGRWRRSAPRVLRAALRRHDVVTIGHDAAVVTAEFDELGAVGRQTQTWVRAEAGWRVLSGHVSTRATVVA